MRLIRNAFANARAYPYASLNAHLDLQANQHSYSYATNEHYC